MRESTTGDQLIWGNVTLNQYCRDLEGQSEYVLNYEAYEDVECMTSREIHEAFIHHGGPAFDLEYLKNKLHTIKDNLRQKKVTGDILAIYQLPGNSSFDVAIKKHGYEEWFDYKFDAIPYESVCTEWFLRNGNVYQNVFYGTSNDAYITVSYRILKEGLSQKQLENFYKLLKTHNLDNNLTPSQLSNYTISLKELFYEGNKPIFEY